MAAGDTIVSLLGRLYAKSIIDAHLIRSENLSPIFSKLAAGSGEPHNTF